MFDAGETGQKVKTKIETERKTGWQRHVFFCYHPPSTSTMLIRPFLAANVNAAKLTGGWRPLP